MAINTTVNVAYDTKTGQFTITGGNTPADDGTVDADWGPGNQITFVPTGSNTTAWYLTGITWTPTAPAALTWAWVDGKPNTSILVTDDDEIPSGRAPVEYAYVLTAQVVATGRKVKADPNIINKPAPGQTRRMGGYA